MGAIEQTSFFENAEYIAPDSIFELTKRFEADRHPVKVNLGQGAYRDETGSPWVLPSVQMAKRLVSQAGHEYLPIRGLSRLCDGAAKLVLHGTTAWKEQMVAAYQAVSGTGALFLVASTLKKARTNIHTIYVTDPSWSNHVLLFHAAGYKVKKIPYYSDSGQGFEFEAFIHGLKRVESGSAVVLHACAHNPTGYDPTQEQWEAIATVVKHKKIFPIFDAAYLGFCSGSVDDDAWAIRHFTETMQLEAAICLSFAKSMGLYGERVGVALVVTDSAHAALVISSIMENVQRSTISNPPAYGARIAATIIGDANLARQWSDDLATMSGRIHDMRKRLYDGLMRRGTPGDWSKVMKQNGMFGYLGLSPVQIRRLEEHYHIYIAETSRISIAGINDGNVEYVAQAFDEVTRGTQ